jgi:mannonate dehydratase
MQLATVLSPLSRENLRLAAQCGVEGVVSRYPGPGREALRAVRDQIAGEGLRLLAVEGHLPIERIKLGLDHDGAEIAEVQTLIRHMGELGIPLLCTNFMAGSDWVRTRMDAPERGGARVTAFDLAEAERAVSLSATTAGLAEPPPVSAEALWERLGAFLREILPVAEAHGVTLVMHPDDPPLPVFRHQARILNSVEAFERLVALVPSPSNAICFCVGTFVAMGVSIPEAIARLGRHIRYVHFRDVRGTAESFVETFHDNGPTDMVAVMRALREAGYDGPMRPDHVPQLEGEEDGDPGYTMLGRLYAYGYIRGLIQATEGGQV